MTYQYKTFGTCSKLITIEAEDNIIKRVEYLGGCPGNLLGIGKLVVGMDIDTVIERFAGTPCGNRPTSCPDQLARALAQIKSGELKAVA